MLAMITLAVQQHPDPREGRNQQKLEERKEISLTGTFPQDALRWLCCAAPENPCLRRRFLRSPEWPLFCTFSSRTFPLQEFVLKEEVILGLLFPASTSGSISLSGSSFCPWKH